MLYRSFPAISRCPTLHNAVAEPTVMAPVAPKLISPEAFVPAPVQPKFEQRFGKFAPLLSLYVPSQAECTCCHFCRLVIAKVMLLFRTFPLRALWFGWRWKLSISWCGYVTRHAQVV